MTTIKKKTPAAKPKATNNAKSGNLDSAGLGTSPATTESGPTILTRTMTQRSTTDVNRIKSTPDSI
jgi:hypothetical protein